MDKLLENLQLPDLMSKKEQLEQKRAALENKIADLEKNIELLTALITYKNG